jgi:hypothetical protein
MVHNIKIIINFSHGTPAEVKDTKMLYAKHNETHFDFQCW